MLDAEGVTRVAQGGKSAQGFVRVDPLADKYPAYSPYNYVLNNPISNTDPTGMSVNNEYVKDTETGEVVKVGDKGGNETDYVYEGRISEDGKTVVYSEDNPTVIEVDIEYDVGPGTDSPRAQSENPTPGHRYTHGRTHTDLLAYGAILSLFTGTPVSGVLGAASKRRTFKGGSQKQRDQTIFQYPKEFRRWYHKQYKKKGDKDATKSELKDIFDDWTQQGRPSGD